LIRIDGGLLLNQAKIDTLSHVIDTRPGATVLIDGIAVHNIVPAGPDPSRPGCWATGGGDLRITNSHAFDYGGQPLRLIAGDTTLADPDFRAPDWQDPIWRINDTRMPTTSRQGEAADNLRLVKTRLGEETGLAAIKAQGTGTPAMFALMAMPVRHADKVLAGFRARRDPARPGSDGTLFVSPGWLRMEGYDANHLPIVARQAIVGTLTVTIPDDDFILVSPLASRQGRTPPRWATHFVMLIDLAKADRATFFFNGLWCDTI
jgi:hypothetical protein